MFKKILSQHWQSLNPLLQKHYGLKNNQSITMQGELAVKHGKFIKFFMPLIRITGALVPVEGEKFQVMVKNKRIDNTFYWHREFKKDGKIYLFKSKMQQFGNDIVEFVGLGIGIRMGLKVENGGLYYEDKGYIIKMGKYLIPIPLHLLVGQSHIQEYVNENNSHDFEMNFQVYHPWFGFAFSYSGYFNLN